MKILAIDDKQDNLTTLQAVLADRLPEARIQTAQSGRRGIELAQDQDPDVILLDIVMPGMDGYAVCRQLKEDEYLRSIPVLFLTALRVDRESRIKALEAGAEGFLSKPFDEVELIAQIRAMTKIKAANRMQRREKEELAALVAERTSILEQELVGRLRVEAALRESEATVRNKLKAIIEPEGDIGSLELADIIDASVLESLLGDFYQATGMLGAILDISGKVLVAIGWQDICTKFHRCHPDTLKNCLESDTILTQNVPHGTFKAYRCKNHMWDMVTPLIIGDRHVGNVFIGQFFYDDETPDVELFREQARRHGFDEVEYIAALERVPHFSRETAQAGMQFYAKLAGLISRLSFGAIQQSRLLAERQQTEEVLRESELRFRTLADSGKALIWTSGLDKQRDYFNQPWLDFTGRSLAQETGNGWSENLHPDDLDRYLQVYADAFDRRECFSMDYRLPRHDGEFRWIQDDGSPRYDSRGVFLGFIGHCIDITERRQAEVEKEKLQAQLAQAQKMESIGRLAGGVAHDFNNMLGVILGHAEMALDEIDPASPLHASLEAVQQAAERSAALTRQLLAFARKQTVSPKVIDLNETVDGMLIMLHRLIGEDIDLLWKPGRSLWPIKIDPSQIDQLLANLCVNARDAIAGVGTITIETALATFDESYCDIHLGSVPGEYVLLAVSDDGCGMDKEILAHIFEPFFTTKEQGKGTGLGLASIFGVVKQNHGFINVYSEPGQGTTFKIYLPRYTVPSATITDRAVEQPAKRGNETILLVEDESEILKMTTMMLTRLGYTVVASSTPGEAIRLAHQYQGQIDLLLTDVVMPEMNGRDLARNLLSHYPNLKRLFMSGYTADVIAHHGVLNDGVHFIEKPFSMKELGGKLREALEGLGDN